MLGATESHAHVRRGHPAYPAVEKLTEIAVADGMHSLLADGIRKAVRGQTTIEEVLRVVSLPV